MGQNTSNEFTLPPYSDEDAKWFTELSLNALKQNPETMEEVAKVRKWVEILISNKETRK